jgi:hypothetical protein
LVATDGGLHYAPKNQPPLEKIKKIVGSQQCWDICIWNQSLLVATYNNGLYRFNLKSGHLINHNNHPNLQKIRRLRSINGRLFCIARHGIYEFADNKLIPRLLSERDLPLNNMPMDVFIRKGQLHALSYPNNTIVQQTKNGDWVSWKNILEASGQKLPETYFNNISAFQTDTSVILGGVNHYTVINNFDVWTLYSLKADHHESWAFWDFQIHQNQLYAAVSNTNDFDDGFLHAHNPKITAYNPPHAQSIWSITPSKLRNAIWISTETDGVHLLIQPEKNHFTPIDFSTKILATANFIVGNNSNFLTIDFETHNACCDIKQFKQVGFEDRIREVVEINHVLYLLGAKKLWSFEPLTRKLKPLFDAESFQWMHVKNSTIWLFKPYQNIWIYDPETSKFTETPYEAKADCVRESNGLLFYHIMGKSFAFIDKNNRQHLLTSDKSINQYTLNFEIVNDMLLIENGNSYDVFRIFLKEKKLHFLTSINLNASFRDFSVIQTLSNGSNLYLYSGKYLVEIDIDSKYQQPTIRRQLYLGQWRIQGPIILAGNRFIIDRGNTTQTIQFEPTLDPQFEVQYSFRDNPKFFSRPYFAVNTEKNFRITVSGTHYFDLQRSLYSVELTDVKTGQNQRGFFRGDAHYWINGIGLGKFNLAISLKNHWKSKLIIGTTEFYRDFPFWLMLLSILSLLYWVFYNQIRTQESQQKRIATLQLKTLQSNFNPHFIYNSMSLIQSLIIGAETKKAIDVTARLAKLNRMFLSNSNKELIYLKDELDFIKEYVAMEKLRFESDTNFLFQIRVSHEVRITEWLIPPMILQPLIENAIKHGVLVSKGPAEIYIDILLNRTDELEIKIVNTHALKNKKRVHGLGIGNQLVSDRLAILNELYPNQFQTQFDFGFKEHHEYHAIIRITQLRNTGKFANYHPFG